MTTYQYPLRFLIRLCEGNTWLRTCAILLDGCREDTASPRTPKQWHPTRATIIVAEFVRIQGFPTSLRTLTSSATGVFLLKISLPTLRATPANHDDLMPHDFSGFHRISDLSRNRHDRNNHNRARTFSLFRPLRRTRDSPQDWFLRLDQRSLSSTNLRSAKFHVPDQTPTAVIRRVRGGIHDDSAVVRRTGS